MPEMSVKEKRYMSGFEKDIGIRRISRRSFLKTAGLAAGATTLTVGTRPVLKALAVDSKLSQASDEAEKIFRAICRPNCFGYCALNVHVRDGKVVKTSQASFPDERYNRICLRGLTHPQRIYSPTRIKYPMKRAGRCGEGKWERISWEQAINYIADELGRVRKKYSNKAETYGQILTLTRQDIINDDLSAFMQIPEEIGRSGAALPSG